MARSTPSGERKPPASSFFFILVSPVCVAGLWHWCGLRHPRTRMLSECPSTTPPSPADGAQTSPLRYAEAGSGVYGCAPTKCELHTYKQSVTLGSTTLSHQQVKQVRSPERHSSQPPRAACEASTARGGVCRIPLTGLARRLLCRAGACRCWGRWRRSTRPTATSCSRATATPSATSWRSGCR
jgi:hypothetical protein